MINFGSACIILIIPKQQNKIIFLIILLIYLLNKPLSICHLRLKLVIPACPIDVINEEGFIEEGFPSSLSAPAPAIIQCFFWYVLTLQHANQLPHYKHLLK